jgi:predicted  nucleic acid-binding Zn-ribbon protein
MNDDIKTMIELQRYWHAMRSSRNKIEDSLGVIKKREDQLAGVKKAFSALGETIKELKGSVKRHELDLAEKDARIKMLDERKKNISTQKELSAVEKEIDVLKFDIGALEEKILALIDDLDEKEKRHLEIAEEILSEENRFAEKRRKLDEDMAEHEKKIKLNEEKFAGLIDRLGAAYKSRFVKMLNSKEGTAIAKLEGEICGNCNFSIPASLVMDTSRKDAITTCTNCGRYLYI